MCCRDLHSFLNTGSHATCRWSWASDWPGRATSVPPSPTAPWTGGEIIVQDKEYIAADEVIFARAEAGRRSLSVTADLLGAPAHPQGNRRMFITRAAHRGRTIANFEELRPVLERHGFEIVDTDGMSLQDQIALFASTAVLAGIHGAGLANMVYRRNAPCTVLEIFPPTEESTWFAAMAGHLGFAYHALSGEAMGRIFDRNAPFDVDPARLEAWLKCITAMSR